LGGLFATTIGRRHDEQTNILTTRDFRKNFETTFKARGYTYDQCAPAYHYGYAIGTDPRYLDQNWMAIVEEIRREWGSRGQGTWEEFEGAVRYGWDRGHGREQSVQVTL